MEDGYQKWEYRKETNLTMEALMEIGQDGWELTGYSAIGTLEFYIFKRPANSAPASRLMPWEDDPISVVRAELDKWDSSSFRCKQGYATRFSRACSFLGIETVGQLVKLGSYGYGKCRNIGQHHVQVVKDVLDELYGIENW